MRLINIDTKLDNDIKDLWKYIYQDEFDLSIATDAYNCRQIDPFVIFGDKVKPIGLNNIDHIEWDYKKIVGFIPDQRVQSLYKKYHSSKYKQRYNETKTIKLEDVSDHLLRHLQNNIIQLLNEKEIAIESIPTSNIKISFYENYEDHHIFNWTNPDGKTTNLTPNVVIGSDDPGIFSNSLRTEFSQLYLASLKKGYSKDATINWLKDLNSNAKRFTFL